MQARNGTSESRAVTKELNMKTALTLLLSCASLVLAQNPQPDPKPVQIIKRLASVTWDLDTHKLVWMVQKGTEVNGEFVASSTDRYEVSPEEAMMASKDEKRGLAQEEAGSVTDLVNLLSLYCAESTDWWEQGSPAEESAAPKQAPDTPDSKKAAPSGVPSTDKPTRVDEKQQPKDPSPRIPGTLVASNALSGK
jgi:hypothetical protein